MDLETLESDQLKVENLGSDGYFSGIVISGKIQLRYLRGNTPSKSTHVTVLMASALEARGFILVRDTDLSSFITVAILLILHSKIKIPAQNRPQPLSSSSFPIQKSSYLTRCSASRQTLFSLSKSYVSLKKE